MKRKKLLAMVVGMTMCLSVFSGCSSTQQTEEDSSKQTEQNTVETAKKVDSGQKATEGTKISEKERTIKILMSEHPNQPIKNMAPAQQEILKKTNIKLEFEVVPSNYPEKKNIVLATNTFPDIIQLEGSQDINTYYQNGIFLPLMQYRDLMPNFKAVWDQYPDLTNLLRDGELYAFPVIRWNEAAGGYGPCIRMDLLEKNNLKAPTTWDELLTTLGKLKELYPDNTPWVPRKGTTRGLFSTTAYSLGSGYNIYYDKDVDGGKYLYGPTQPEFKKVLEYYNKAYELEVLGKDYASLTSDQWKTKLNSGEALFFVDNSGFSIDFTLALQKSDPDARFEFLGSLGDENGNKRAFNYGTYGSRMFAVNANVKDPETVIKFMDWMYSEEGATIANFGVEGTHWEYDNSGEPQFKKDFIANYTPEADAYYKVYSDVGVSMLNFTPYAANTYTMFKINKEMGLWSDLAEEYWNKMANDEGYHLPSIPPAFTDEENERLKDLVTPIDTMLEQEFDKFIMGEKSIDEYDAVIEKAVEMGAREVEDIYNAALNRSK